MELRFEYDVFIIMKLARWATVYVTDNTDFLDYWFNLFKSETKVYIDEPIRSNLASFGVNRWRNDFEIYVDKYEKKPGEGFYWEEREYFAYYSQYLVYELQIPSKQIAELYGKPMFEWLMNERFKFHTFGSNLFMQYFVEKWGLPPGVNAPYRIVNV